MPYAVSLRYQKLYKRATGSFSYPSKRLSSTLMDNNTANNPPGC